MSSFSVVDSPIGGGALFKIKDELRSTRGEPREAFLKGEAASSVRASGSSTVCSWFEAARRLTRREPGILVGTGASRVRSPLSGSSTLEPSSFNGGAEEGDSDARTNRSSSFQPEGTGGVPTGWSVLRQLPPRTTRRGGCHKA